jgi:hypothetical protein
MSSFVALGGMDAERFSRAWGNSPLEGLYAFVWVGPEVLKDNVVLNLKGKKLKDDVGHAQHQVVWRLSDFPEECHAAGRFPLYIGKTTTLFNRVKQHLHLSKEDWMDSRREYRKAESKDVAYQQGFLHKHSTACQFRSGMQHLYPLDKAGFIAKLANIELCFMPSSDVQDRFYLEDLAIGYFRPWFNVDSER